MLFFRYQNTKTLERNSSHYVDMNMLYDRAITEIDFSKDIANIDALTEFLMNYASELSYRENLKENDYFSLVKEISKIILNNYNEEYSTEMKITARKNAINEIERLMESYPLKGLFVIPQYSEDFYYGTKYSISELRSEIMTSLGVPSAKYLAVYKGEVLCKEMDFGGTLIKPTELLHVYDLYEESQNKNQRMDDTIFYRDCVNINELLSRVEDTKETVRDYIKFGFSSEGIMDKINTHLKELILFNLLSITKSDYKSLEYRNTRNSHYIKVKKANNNIIFCIPEKEITLDNFLNSEKVIYEGQFVIKDLHNNILKKEFFKLNLTV